MRALVAVAKTTNFKPDKHMLIAAAFLLPAGILNGRKQTQKGGKKWGKGKGWTTHGTWKQTATQAGGLCCNDKSTSVPVTVVWVRTPVADSCQ